jgi:type IV secretion system protein VirB7
MKIILSILFFNLLSGCAKPPDLQTPCRDFGKHCSQQPINEDVQG